MEKSKKFKPLPFCLKTQLLKYSISDDLVEVVLKLPSQINLLELHDVLRATFNVSSTRMFTFGINSECLFFVGKYYEA